MVVDGKVPEYVVPEHLIGDGPCQRCGEENIRWWTQSEFWNNVIAEWRGQLLSRDDPGGIYCIHCFVTIVDKVGYEVPSWELRPVWPAVRR